MKGYLLNFFKYAAIDLNNFEEDDTWYRNTCDGEDFVKSIVWSVFDRLEIREIDKFEDFRLSQASEKKWVGERQCSLFYEINSEKKKLQYRKDKDKCKFTFHKNYEKSVTAEEQEMRDRRFRFFGISMLDLTPEMHALFYTKDNPDSVLYTEMTKAINSLIERNHIETEDVCYELYGTLGGNDFAVVWLANEYKDIVTIIEALRKSYIKSVGNPVVANVSTIIGLRDINNENISYEDVNGKFNIRFTKKGAYNEEEFKGALKECLGLDNVTFETTLGEHDLSWKIDAIILTKKLYGRDGVVHIGNDKFVDNIIQANTELSVELDYSSLEPYIFNKVSRKNRTVITLNERKEVYDNIREITEMQIFMKLPYLKETLWLIYEDYLRNISSAFSYPWISDLHYQFSNSMNYLKKLIQANDEEVPESLKFSIIKELVGTLRQTILHVAQANRLFFEIPNTHLKNTGSYSKILRTYYGIVKKLLKQIYAIPKKSKQSIIVPFITFDVTPEITSNMLTQVEESEYIIVIITLPYEALVNIPKYSKLLAHEVYHYVAPNSRKTRNSLIGILSVSSTWSLILNIYIFNKFNEFKDIIKEANNIPELFRTQINEITLKYVISNYEKVMEHVKKYDENLVWRKYVKNLSETYGKNSHILSQDTNVHKKIFEIIEQLKKIVVKEVIGKAGSDNVVGLVKRKFEQINFDDFSKWMCDMQPYQKFNAGVLEIRYALREAAADYFMIQILNENTGIREYYDLFMYYRKLLESNQESLCQIYRIGMLTDYLFRDITDKLKDGNAGQVIEALRTNLVENVKLDNEKSKDIITTFIKYYEVFKPYREVIFKYFDDMDFSSIGDTKFKKVLAETRKLWAEDINDNFEKGIHYIGCFQIQEELSDLPQYQTVDRELDCNVVNYLSERLHVEKLPSIVNEKTYLYARNVDTLIQYIEEARKTITDSGEFEPIWFRGHKSSQYKLLPSLYRMKDGKSEFFKNVSHREVMESLFKAFKVKAYGSSEIFLGGDNTTIGIMASMQHYSVPTNILDWSTSAFVAMYFALEDQMVSSEKEKRERTEAQTDAEIWLLNPIRLNKARKWLSANRMEDSVIKEYPIDSLCGEEDKYKEYLPFSEPKDAEAVPVAVYVPHINQRIKAQMGTFTMFSLDHKVLKKETDESVCYYDLVAIQEKYKEECKSEEYKPFLASVKISKECMNDVADWLRQMGVSKPNIYPELNHISESLTSEMKNYWEQQE